MIFLVFEPREGLPAGIAEENEILWSLTTGTTGGAATPVDGIISTRRGNAGSWMPMIGKSPFGRWELALPNTEELKNRFKEEEIQDILFVITYSGRTPAWPA